MMTKLAAKLGLPLFVLGLAVAPAMAQTAPAAPAPAAKAAGESSATRLRAVSTALISARPGSSASTAQATAK